MRDNPKNKKGRLEGAKMCATDVRFDLQQIAFWEFIIIFIWAECKSNGGNGDCGFPANSRSPPSCGSQILHERAHTRTSIYAQT